MPLYEFHCKKCNHIFERIQKFSDPPMKTCSKCGGDVEQLISPPAIQFKGSGWYVTDYAHRSSEPAPRNAHNGTSKNGGTDVKAESAKSGTKAESKSAESGSKDKK